MKRLLVVMFAASLLISGCSFGRGETIGNSSAETIAMEDAGVSENDVTRKKTSLDLDDGRQIYEVDFTTDSADYSYHIDAESGEIIEYEKEDRIRPQTTAQPQDNAQSNTDISEDDAKRIALEHAGVSDAERYRSKIDYDDGRKVYEIEFYKDGYDYDYEIDCSNGEIVKYDSEKQLF